MLYIKTISAVISDSDKLYSRWLWFSTSACIGVFVTARLIQIYFFKNCQYN